MTRLKNKKTQSSKMRNRILLASGALILLALLVILLVPKSASEPELTQANTVLQEGHRCLCFLGISRAYPNAARF